MAAILLGQIVRFQRDRKYPESLPLETVDVLAKIVSGRKCQDFDILGVVAHRQQAEHREGVRDTEVCQAQQHGLHPRPAVTVDQMGCG